MLPTVHQEADPSGPRGGGHCWLPLSDYSALGRVKGATLTASALAEVIKTNPSPAKEPPTQGHDMDMGANQKTAAIYLRKPSVDNRNGNNRSISEQRHECLAAAEREGLTVVQTYEERVGGAAPDNVQALGSVNECHRVQIWLKQREYGPSSNISACRRATILSPASLRHDAVPSHCSSNRSSTSTSTD